MIILSILILLTLLIVLFLQVSTNKTLISKLSLVEISTSFLESETRTRNAEYKARKDWKNYRERNLPRAKSPRIPRSSLSTDDMKRKADELERQMR